MPADVPARHSDYAAWEAQLPALLPLLRDRSKQLVDFMMLGVFAAHYIRLGLRNRIDAEPMRRAARTVMERNGLRREAFDDLVRGGSKPARTVDELVSPALRMLVELVRGLRPEPKTCFVAMPFSAPFEDYYPSFYRPMLARAGYRAIRAWGGFGREDFSPLLVAMILKSGVVLADVSTSSPNVIWEVGVAQGAGKPVFLIQGDKHEAPADLASHVALGYSAASPEWPDRAVDELHVSIALQAAAIDKLKGDPIRIASGLRGTDVQSMATELMDIFWEASFNGSRSRGESVDPGHLKRGLERIKSRRWADAVADFDCVLDHGFDRGEGGVYAAAHFGRGLALLPLRRYREAETSLTSAAKLGLSDALLMRLLAEVRFNLGRADAARADVDRALVLGPEDRDALLLRTLIAARQGDLDQCRRDGEELGRLSPRGPGTIAAAGYLNLAGGDFAKAADLFRKARVLAFGRAWHFEAGLAALLTGDADGADRDYRVGLRHGSDSDIDDALRDIRFWTGRVWDAQAMQANRHLVRKVRRLLLQVRTPRAWARESGTGRTAAAATAKSAR